MPVGRIVSKALEIVDAEGASSLTMRTLAQRLDTSPTVLYRAVTDRADLLDRVVDAALEEVHFDFSPERGHWKVDLRSGALAMFEVLSRHRGVAPLMIERVPTGPRSRVLRERLLAMLLSHGLSPESASLAYATLVRFVVGFAAQLVGNGSTASEEAARISEAYRDLDLSQLPATVAVAQFLPFQTIETEFEFGLDLILDGLSTYLVRKTDA